MTTQDAKALTLALGGRWNSILKYGSAKCPVHDDRSPSLSIRDGKMVDRVLLHCFVGCDSRDIVAELRRRGLLEELTGAGKFQRHGAVTFRQEPEHKPDEIALALWKGAQVAPPDSVVARYLKSRGIDTIPPTIRAGYSVHAGRIQMPVMVVAVQSPGGDVIAVQSTMLTLTGKRAPVSTPRITTGALGYGAARFGKAYDVLGLAEGTESALSAMALSGAPCWASLGAARLHRVAVPDSVLELHVFADNDEPGRAAAERTAAAHKSRRVVLRFPPEQFKDWNDALQAQAVEA